VALFKQDFQNIDFIGTVTGCVSNEYGMQLAIAVKLGRPGKIGKKAIWPSFMHSKISSSTPEKGKILLTKLSRY